MTGETFITFCDRVQGYLHITRSIPCEDYAEVYSAPDGRFHIAAVADGHGETSCVRSAKGSQFAAEAAVHCLKEFATSGLNGGTLSELQQPRTAQADIKRLTDTILDRWNRRAMDDLHSIPLNEDELKLAGSFAEKYRRGENLEHIYGTTLIAALLLPPFLVLLQQGDGRCEVQYADGHIDQPIPWDDRCCQNVTTSLSDSDAAEGFRHSVIDLREHPVIACYLGSDGVEDSFPDMAGTHAFYMDLSCELAGRTMPDFYQYLDERLPDFSRRGSGDDVSIAGIVNPEELYAHRADFQKAIQHYMRSTEEQALTAKLQSMERKYHILKQRMEQHPDNDAAAQAFRDYDARYQAISDKLNALRQAGTS